MKEMCLRVPVGACPNCGHKQFIVVESDMSLYLTNRDGEIIDSKNMTHSAIGKCCRCGLVIDMITTRYGFIPATKLRKILFDYDAQERSDNEELKKEIPNPMEVGQNDG